jgi:hypothetical protein
MFGSTSLEIAIGLVLIFLLFSLILTALRESWETFSKLRARDLEKTVAEMLQDKKGDGLRKEFFEHPLIYALYRGGYQQSELTNKPHGIWKNAPSYIPTAQAASALIDLFRSGKAQGPVGEAIVALSNEVGQDAQALHEKVGAWYDAAMERASGAYRRDTQKWLLVAGFVLAAVLNFDAIRIARELSISDDKRTALVTLAEGVAAQRATATEGTDSAETQEQVPVTANFILDGIDSIDLPLGWSWERIESPCTAQTENGFGWCVTGTIVTSVIWGIPGWAIMALAATLGAPFWFDMLQKLVVIRSTMKPKPETVEKAPEAKVVAPPPPAAPAQAPSATLQPDRDATYLYG